MQNHAFAYINPSDPAPTRGGALADVRVALQPNISVRGWPASAGSRALEGYAALEDATTVERLRAAGAHLAGYTHMAELGFGLDDDSSAGSVLASACDAALMTDTLGEARVAAAEAGLLGFKPSAGVISRYGLIGLIPSMESPAVMARDLPTLAGVLQAISGPDDRDFSLGEEFPAFALPSGDQAAAGSMVVIPHSLAALSPTERAAFDAALETLRSAGAGIREVPMDDYALCRTVHQIVGSVEASSSAGKYDGVRYGYRAPGAEHWNEMYLKSREEAFGPLVKGFLFQGAWFQFKNYPAYENACRIRRRLVAALNALPGDADFIVLPSRRTSVPTISPTSVPQVYDRFALTLAANVAGLPAISLPGFVMAGDDDLGLQLIARRLDDVRLLSCAVRLLNAVRATGAAPAGE